MTATQDTPAAVDADKLRVQRDYLIGVLVDQACSNRAIGLSQAGREQVITDTLAKILRQVATADESSFFVQLARGEA